jgi:hypothetical protein
MRDLFSGVYPSSEDCSPSSPSPLVRPLPTDAWATSSLLQKAIRRGDADLAERAAITLYRLRGKGIWRRFMVIAFEDVGIGSLEAIIKTTTACTDPNERASIGGDERAVCFLARLLAEAPKDRSPDHLMGAAWSYPKLEEARCMVGERPLAKRLSLVADTSLPLPVRAIAAWYSSGLEWGHESRVGRGDLPGLMTTFRLLGVPPDLVVATRHTPKRTREPITIMAPLLWLAASAAGDHRIVDCPVPPVTMIGDIPSYVFDKHTSAGKAAIHRFAHENHAVRGVLTAYVPERRAKEAACMAAFHVDAAPVSRRFEWDGSVELERLGVEADMLKVGVPREGIAPLLNVVRDNLDHLNAIRAKSQFSIDQSEIVGKKGA